MKARVTLHHARMQVLEVLRAPGYLLPIFVFPSMFFMFFAHPDIENVHDANLFVACYVLYAILGVVFYLLLGEISDDRRNVWEDYLKTLPHGSWSRLSGWALTGTLAATVAVLVLCAVAWFATPVRLTADEWLLLVATAVIGTLPFGLLGVSIGYWVTPKFAQPIGNVIYFSLVFAGGIWTLPRGLPYWVDWISPYLPTRMWAELAWAVVNGRSWPVYSAFGLLGYTGLFGILAALGLRRYLRLRYGSPSSR